MEFSYIASERLLFLSDSQSVSPCVLLSVILSLCLFCLSSFLLSRARLVSRLRACELGVRVYRLFS